jgi:hypothetical protein
MASVNAEEVILRLMPPGSQAAEVGRLVDPWIGDEGPMEADFRRAIGGAGSLRPRGVAFDDTTTVTWDEAGVQILQAAPAGGAGGIGDIGDIVALRSEVVLHSRFAERGPKTLFRIDYLQRGALLGSRFTTEGGGDA